MNPSLRDQLKDWKKLHQEPVPKKMQPHQKQQKRKSEHLNKEQPFWDPANKMTIEFISFIVL